MHSDSDLFRTFPVNWLFYAQLQRTNVASLTLIISHYTSRHSQNVGHHDAICLASLCGHIFCAAADILFIGSGIIF